MSGIGFGGGFGYASNPFQNFGRSSFQGGYNQYGHQGYGGYNPYSQQGYGGQQMWQRQPQYGGYQQQQYPSSTYPSYPQNYQFAGSYPKQQQVSTPAQSNTQPVRQAMSQSDRYANRSQNEALLRQLQQNALAQGLPQQQSPSLVWSPTAQQQQNSQQAINSMMRMQSAQG